MNPLNQDVDNTDVVISLLKVALDLSRDGVSDSELPKHLEVLVFALTDPEYSESLGVEDAFSRFMDVETGPIDQPKPNPIRELLTVTQALAIDDGREVLAQDLRDMIRALEGAGD